MPVIRPISTNSNRAVLNTRLSSAELRRVGFSVLCMAVISQRLALLRYLMLGRLAGQILLFQRTFSVFGYELVPVYCSKEFHGLQRIIFSTP
jgi:hypothetical protein